MIKIKCYSDEIVKANSLFSAQIEIYIDEVLKVGDKISLGIRHVSDFGDAQMKNKYNPNYIRVITEGNVEFSCCSEDNHERHPWNRGFEVKIEKGTIVANAKILLVLKNFFMQSFVEEQFVMRMGYKKEIDEKWISTPLQDSISLKIIGNRPEKIKLNVRDINAGKPKRELSLKVEDAYGNPTFLDEIFDFYLNDKEYIGTERVCNNMQILNNINIPDVNEYSVITAVSRDGSFFAKSNPFGVSLFEDYSLYWGEIHCQSMHCDGTQSVPYLYKYGKEAAGLDFAAITSHDNLLTPYDWSMIKEGTKNAMEDNDYITFLGYEWSGKEKLGGDNNIYFLEDDVPLVYSGPYNASKAYMESLEFIDKERNINQTLDELKSFKKIDIPHFGGRKANFQYFDEKTMFVTEIHSCHRCYEDIVTGILESGIKVGFVAGSDDHRGAIGDSKPCARERYFSSRSGLIGLYSPKFDKDNLMGSICDRHVYATNGNKMILSFSVNGYIMGSEFKVQEDDLLTFEWEVITDGWFEKVQLIKPNQIVNTYSENVNKMNHVNGKWELRARKGLNIYYLKAFQTDGGIAWSSPIWIIAN